MNKPEMPAFVLFRQHGDFLYGVAPLFPFLANVILSSVELVTTGMIKKDLRPAENAKKS